MSLKYKKFFFLFALLFIFSGSFLVCHAAVSWEIRNGTLYVNGSGAMTDYTSAAQTPWYANRDNIIFVTVTGDVTHIGDYAFSSLPNLTGVSIGSSVSSIGNYSFYDNSKLMNVQIPGNVEYIGAHAFFRATALISVTFGEGVKSIDNYAFSRCYNLRGIVFPDSLTTLGIHVFNTCDSLKTVRFGKGLKAIGSNCFYACYSLEDITIPASVETLGEFIFSNCSRLKNVTILCPITTLPAGTFSYTPIASVTLPRTLTSIDKRAFLYCTSLTTVTFKGNSSEWAKITVLEDNDGLDYATVKCEETLYIVDTAYKKGMLSLSVAKEKPADGILITAIYDHSGRFVTMKKQPISYTETSANVTISAPESGTVGVVLWHTIECFTPLANSDTVIY